MGYQEFLVSVNKKNKDRTATHLTELLEEADAEYELNYLTTIQDTVRVYDLTGKDLGILNAGDEFLLLQGDLTDCEEVLKHIRNKSYPMEAVVRCAMEQGVIPCDLSACKDLLVDEPYRVMHPRINYTDRDLHDLIQESAEETCYYDICAYEDDF